MPRPKVTTDMTTTSVAGRLGMSTGKLVSWIGRGVLPPPTNIDKNGVRYFDRKWLSKARMIVEGKKS